MRNKNITIIYIVIFIGLICVYGYIWVLVEILNNNIYAIESLKKDLILSIGMAFISTTGFYLKIRLAQKNKKNP